MAKVIKSIELGGSSYKVDEYTPYELIKTLFYHHYINPDARKVHAWASIDFKTCDINIINLAHTGKTLQIFITLDHATSNEI